jgi:HD-like signal output (HDOD) protein
MARVQPLFYRILAAHKEDSSTLEQKIFGIDHNLAGLHLAESWKLPEVIKDVILFHHHPDKALKNSELVHLVYVSDAIAHSFLPGFEIEHIDTAPFDESLNMLMLSPEMVVDALGVFTDIF